MIPPSLSIILSIFWTHLGLTEVSGFRVEVGLGTAMDLGMDLDLEMEVAETRVKEGST